MSKLNANLTYIYKLRSSRLRKAKWHLDNYTLKEARNNEELIAIADSQALRFIREIRGIDQDENRNAVTRIRTEISTLKKERRTRVRGATISKLYDDLYSAVFMKDYISVIMDSMADFDRLNASKGFYINGLKYKRLLATPGGVKKNTVVYVSEEVYSTLADKIDNGRNKDIQLVPAKFEAYKALTCSASKPVPSPAGVLVVKDCKVPIVANIVHITEDGPEPTIRDIKDYELLNNNSDGYGLITPELSRRWAESLGLDYIPSGFCIRNAFTKGMLFTFDYYAWSKEIAESDEVLDVWGKKRSVSASEIILTESMLKLWNSYDSIEHYLSCCENGGYSYSVTKATPKKLENERNLNYQFIQSLHLSDEGIDELIEPTVSEIKEVLGGDYRKTLLFLKGIHMNEMSFEKSDFDFVKALMIEKEMINDPFVRKHVHKMISRRIQEAKMGELRIKGNYSILSGDPYSLCQSMFGMKITGLLKAGEFYHSYWSARGVEKVAGFRAPMTCHNNIRIFSLANTSEMNHWYRYMDTVTIFNSHDTTAQALNGADMDSDTVFTTNNPTIMQSIREQDAIICAQKTALKRIIVEEDLIRANKMSFGDQIGSITNRITAMYEILAKYPPGSNEYKTMEYRIKCGQNYQQNAIDQAKGIQSNPMPKSWYDYHANVIEESDSEEVAELKRFNQSIVAEKKPYFMIYRYPELKKKIDRFMSATEVNCRNRFGCTLEQLLAKADKTEEQTTFLRYYYIKMPVSQENSVMNKICRKVEGALAGVKELPINVKDYDYSRLKSDSGYPPIKYKEIAELYCVHRSEVKDYMALRAAGLVLSDEEVQVIDGRTFVEDAYRICNDAEQLCNIVIDLCYRTNQSKQFAWDIAGETIISHLLKANEYMISYPIADPEGDIEFKGERYAMLTSRYEGAD
ncbi:RNA dependent RNA polymerase [Cohnella herbarum]|uniref:RDRP core domain-containing protein n=1 Tax=Cohnella herbarum TaxID=2728023 RepID=A0A7Z2ZLN2_9BACL|nr:hypothetical protein [Cohnella herbarum]QJD84005.1 hypothetical protein HH215_12970 [Cohnella herbarum]